MDVYAAVSKRHRSMLSYAVLPCSYANTDIILRKLHYSRAFFGYQIVELAKENYPVRKPRDNNISVVSKSTIENAERIQ